MKLIITLAATLLITTAAQAKEWPCNDVIANWNNAAPSCRVAGSGGGTLAANLTNPQAKPKKETPPDDDCPKDVGSKS
jgi:hypothetical protein